MAISGRPGATVRSLRKARNWTLAQLAERTGIPVSTLSRIEKDQPSPNYDQLVRLSKGLQIDIARLFSANATADGGHRRSVNRLDEGQVLETATERLLYLSTDLLNKSFTPMLSLIKARSIDDYPGFHRHPGEEFVFVVSGELELHTELYAPTVLRAGESIYFDSSMGHAYVARGDEPCRILSICTVPHPVETTDESAQVPVEPARPRRSRAASAGVKRKTTSARQEGKATRKTSRRSGR